MNILIVTYSTQSDRSTFKFDFEHDTYDQLKDDAALLIAHIAETGEDFFFFFAESGINGGSDTAETWSNHGHAAIVNLWQYFAEEDRDDIIDRAIEYLSDFDPESVHSLLRML